MVRPGMPSPSSGPPSVNVNVTTPPTTVARHLRPRQLLQYAVGVIGVVTVTVAY